MDRFLLDRVEQVSVLFFTLLGILLLLPGIKDFLILTEEPLLHEDVGAFLGLGNLAD